MIIKDRNKRLTLKEVDYWKKMFDAHLMIGTEIEVMFDRATGYVSYSDVEENFEEIDVLNSNSRGRNDLTTLIESVKSDGSLDNGVEIVTSGRKIYGFMPLFAQYKTIIDNIETFDPIVHQRMGWHNHLVLQNSGYKCLELGKNIPRIIFDNLMMLCSYYYPALAYISSTLTQDDAYTRYSHFNQVSCLKSYDHTEDLDDIYEYFDERYNAINILGSDFNSYEETLESFHVEFRFPDGSIFPVQMASLNILFKALVIKAIEISKYGIFSNDREETKDLYVFKNSGNVYDSSMIEVNHNRDSRLSAKVNEETIARIRGLTNELIDFLEKEIKDIDCIAFETLKFLADKPISVLGKELGTTNHREINDYLYEMLDRLFVEDDAEILPLLEVIETKQVTGVLTLEEWCDKASELVSYKEPILCILKRIEKHRKIKFVKNIGITLE